MYRDASAYGIPLGWAHIYVRRVVGGTPGEVEIGFPQNGGAFLLFKGRPRR